MNLIKTVLEQQGRSQTWLAKQIGKSYVVTTNYCNNKAQPSIPVLVKIAEALQIDIRELIESTRNKAGKPETKTKS
jgi:putative transcriptional regulator